MAVLPKGKNIIKEHARIAAKANWILVLAPRRPWFNWRLRLGAGGPRVRPGFDNQVHPFGINLFKIYQSLDFLGFFAGLGSVNIIQKDTFMVRTPTIRATLGIPDPDISIDDRTRMKPTSKTIIGLSSFFIVIQSPFINLNNRYILCSCSSLQLSRNSLTSSNSSWSIAGNINSSRTFRI